MSSTMEIMIMVALMVFTVTGIAGMVMTLWFIKMYSPMMKLMHKQIKEEMED